MTGPSSRWLRLPQGTAPRLEYGADYNPEQWPREVWDDDIALMQQAGVTLVSVGIFSWARLQPAPDRFDFDWLDEVLDLLHAGGISVDLATATASPPPWLTTLHPEILPVDAYGRVASPGARQHWRATSPVFRDHVLALVEQMATRYGEHPALVCWHVNNEYGCHNALDYSDDAAAAFRVWLEARYGDLDGLNRAWGTDFWAQRYSSFTEILPPRHALTHPNPTQQLDFQRFSSDALRDLYRAEAALLRRITPDIPVTTNFMVNAITRELDYQSWVGDVDIASNDHYPRHDRPSAHGSAWPSVFDETAFSASLMSGLTGGRPWWLMEHAPSAVNWQPVNPAKRVGELARDALTHVGHGSDAICFFQWRQSRAGAEKYHSALVPHAGPDSRLFRAVTELGARLADLGDLRGARAVPAQAAVLFDQDSWWASELDSHPSTRLSYREQALRWYTALLDIGIRTDVVPATGTDLSGYHLVIAPTLYVVDEPLRQALHDYVDGGGHLVVTFFSGIVDRDDHIHLGGYPGALRDLLGIRVEEFTPLLPEEEVQLSDGLTGRLWSEQVDAISSGVEVLTRYQGGDLDGAAAITRRAVGSGSASYCSTVLPAAGLRRLLTFLAQAAGVSPELPESVHGQVLVSHRESDRTRFTFLINRQDEPIEVEGEQLPARGVMVRRLESAAE